MSRINAPLAALGGSILLAFTVLVSMGQVINPGVQQFGAVTANHCTKWGPGVGQIRDAGANCAGTPPSGANPTATATTTAVNGSASTFMRSDAAPAVATTTFGGQSVGPGGTAGVQGNGALVQLATGTATTQHCVKYDANGNTVDNGAACATQSSGANPTATAGPAAVNGVATTFLRSDGAPPVQKGTNSQFGIVEGDGTTLSCATTPGVCIALVNGILPTPVRAGDLLLWSGSAWATCAGNNSGTKILQEDSSGNCSWVSAGSGTVTREVINNGTGISKSGTCDNTTDNSGTPCVIALSTPVAVANGGTGDTGTAWTTFTPTLTCGVGAVGAYSKQSGRYKTLGKTVWISVNVQAALGTCASAVTIASLPVTSVTGQAQILSGFDATSGLSLWCLWASATATCQMGTAAGSNPSGSDLFEFNGVIESN